MLGVLKIYGAVWIYQKFLQNGVFQTRWMGIFNAPLVPKWLYLFVAWDTSWYVGLAHFYTIGHTFFPGYPLLIKMFGSVVSNYWTAAIVLSIVLGFALLPVFQGIAESYMSKGEALGSTLIMGSFPYVFVYTTVAYSESLFLFSVLAAWYCYLKGKMCPASLFAVLATFTKTYGVLIVLPMLLDAVTHRRWRRIPLILVPAILVGVFVLLFGGQSFVERMILEINTATWSASPGGTGYFWVRDFVAPIFTFDRPVVLFDYWHCFALTGTALLWFLLC